MLMEFLASSSSSSSSSSSPLMIHLPNSSFNNITFKRRIPASSHRSSSQSHAQISCCSSSTSYTGGTNSIRFTSLSSSRNHVLPSIRRRRGFSTVTAVFERFTERAIKVVVFSQKEAKGLGKDMVFTQHLLLGLIAEEEEDSARNRGGDDDGYLGSGIKLDQARDAVRSIWNLGYSSSSSPRGGGGDGDSSGLKSIEHVPFSISTKRVFDAADQFSKKLGHNFVSPDHISMALITVDDGSAGRVFKRLGMNVDRLADMALSRLKGELAKDGREPSVAAQKAYEKLRSSKASIVKAPEKTKEKTALDQFCVDLTSRASDGAIDSVIGRDSEMRRVIEILCRRTKNNPILIGESGVGKTAIAEGLAIRIAQADVPPYLMTKRIMSLDIGLLMAGAKERGELENRVTLLLKEVTDSGNVILFIDEVHTLVGSGAAGQGNKGTGLDIANLLKPSLGRGRLQCIASTTINEHMMHFEKDKALARRFQPVLINEPSQNDAVRMLLGLQEKYETHHKCRYTPEAIDAAVYLSARYIPDRYLPDKAIDLIDEAGSKARMESCKRKKEEQLCILSKSPDEYWQKIRAVQGLHEEAIASKLIREDGARMQNKGKPSLDNILSSAEVYEEPTVVGPDEIAAVAAVWSGIPVQQLTADERHVLVSLEESLRKRVIGQEEAVTAIAKAVKRSRMDLKDPKRPTAVMLFCGPTGVGKTELTKALAASYFGSEAAMLRLDMSEYMERHTVSKLIGSPPGYVGYGEGGVLTEAIRRRPFTVVLFDEIEKAHPDIFNILLQLFEDGHLTDSQGRRVSFKNALIVMTSNVGSAAIAKGKHNSFGFLTADDTSTTNAGMKSLVMEELKTYLRPELLNRIDEVVVFRPLEKTQMLEILNIMLREVRERLVTTYGYCLEVSKATMDLICEEGYSHTYGARHLRRAVTHLVEDLLSEAILTGSYTRGDTIVVDVDTSGKPFVTNGTDQSIYYSESL